RPRASQPHRRKWARDGAREIQLGGRAAAIPPTSISLVGATSASRSTRSVDKCAAGAAATQASPLREATRSHAKPREATRSHVKPREATRSYAKLREAITETPTAPR